MGRKPSERVQGVRGELIGRLRDGLYRPGDRFLSAREIAATFGVSYQTADRLLDDLQAAGYVERRAASGTFIPSGGESLSEARLFFSGRARREHSFGARLLSGLTARLTREGFSFSISWAETAEAIPNTVFPVLWEAPGVLAACRRAGRPALLLNARPLPGLDAALLDSVSVDDYFGGACAAELLTGPNGGTGAGLAMLTGPDGDPRSDARRDGFLSRTPGAATVSAGGWYTEDGLRVAPDALQRGPRGLFCANDRLAEAVLIYTERVGRPRPRLVGFDDAPVAATRRLTTIAIPWEELLADALEIIRRRLSGDTSAARQRIVTPRPVVRTL